MKTGFSRICITPPMGVPLFGYYEERHASGVLDDLYADAVSFDDGERRALILAVDVCELSNKQANRVRKSISQRLGLDERAIFVNCSHTHTGPSVDFDLIIEHWESEYNEIFYKKLLQVAKDAFSDMRESVFSVGSGLGTAENSAFV